jgi:hypothetical protein
MRRRACGGAVVRLPKIESDPDVEIRLISPVEQEAPFQTFLHVQGAVELATGAARRRDGARAMTNGTPADDQDDLVRLLVLSLIDCHLRRASTDALQVLERDLQMLPRTSA